MKKEIINLKQLLTLCSWTQKTPYFAENLSNTSLRSKQYVQPLKYEYPFFLFFFPQSYISSADKQFVASTIQAIGRCASNISEVTDTCLAGLVRLLSNRDGKKGIPQCITYSYCHGLVKQRTHDSCLKEKDTEWILKRFNI